MGSLKICPLLPLVCHIWRMLLGLLLWVFLIFRALGGGQHTNSLRGSYSGPQRWYSPDSCSRWAFGWIFSRQYSCCLWGQRQQQNHICFCGEEVLCWQSLANITSIAQDWSKRPLLLLLRASPWMHRGRLCRQSLSRRGICQWDLCHSRSRWSLPSCYWSTLLLIQQLFGGLGNLLWGKLRRNWLRPRRNVPLVCPSRTWKTYPWLRHELWWWGCYRNQV